MGDLPSCLILQPTVAIIASAPRGATRTLASRRDRESLKQLGTNATPAPAEESHPVSPDHRGWSGCAARPASVAKTTHHRNFPLRHAARPFAPVTESLARWRCAVGSVNSSLTAHVRHSSRSPCLWTRPSRSTYRPRPLTRFENSCPSRYLRLARVAGLRVRREFPRYRGFPW